MKRKIFGVVLSLLAVTAYAARYELAMPRAEADLYRVDGSDLLVKTKSCDQHLWHTEAILSFLPRSSHEDRPHGRPSVRQDSRQHP